MKLRPTRALTVIGAALVLLAGGAVAYAQIPSADGTISSCYTKSTGTIRIIDTGVACKKGETSLAWNQHGNPGTNGTNGVSGYEMVVKTQNEDVDAFFGSVSADCPAGKKVTGGGGVATTATGGVQDGYRVINSSPKDDSGGWRATFDISNPLGDPFVLKVYAICSVVN
jgi:hypothetical protein